MQARFTVWIDGNRISKAISLARAEKLAARATKNNPTKTVEIR